METPTQTSNNDLYPLVIPEEERDIIKRMISEPYDKLINYTYFETPYEAQNQEIIKKIIKEMETNPESVTWAKIEMHGYEAKQNIKSLGTFDLRPLMAEFLVRQTFKEALDNEGNLALAASKLWTKLLSDYDPNLVIQTSDALLTKISQLPSIQNKYFTDSATNRRLLRLDINFETARAFSYHLNKDNSNLNAKKAYDIFLDEMRKPKFPSEILKNIRDFINIEYGNIEDKERFNESMSSVNSEIRKFNRPFFTPTDIFVKNEIIKEMVETTLSIGTDVDQETILEQSLNPTKPLQRQMDAFGVLVFNLHDNQLRQEAITHLVANLLIREQESTPLKNSEGKLTRGLPTNVVKAIQRGLAYGALSAQEKLFPTPQEAQTFLLNEKLLRKIEDSVLPALAVAQSREQVIMFDVQKLAEESLVRLEEKRKIRSEVQRKSVFHQRLAQLESNVTQLAEQLERNNKSTLSMKTIF